MEIIQLPGYIEAEKLAIARDFLVPKQLEANGLEARAHRVHATPRILELIRHYTRESGVRSLEREIASICRKVAREVVKAGDEAQAACSVTPAARAQATSACRSTASAGRGARTASASAPASPTPRSAASCCRPRSR